MDQEKLERAADGRGRAMCDNQVLSVGGKCAGACVGDVFVGSASVRSFSDCWWEASVYGEHGETEHDKTSAAMGHGATDKGYV